jgi:hypothetical protein
MLLGFLFPERSYHFGIATMLNMRTKGKGRHIAPALCHHALA